VQKKFGFLAGLAALSVFSSVANAAIIDSGPISIAIPNNTDGVYVNLVTLATGTAGAGVAGWDFNPYNASTSITFFWPTTPATSFGGVAVGTVYSNIPVGTVVNAAANYSVAAGGGGAANFVNFATAGPKILGVRFFNEATTAINFGYIQMDKGAAAGFPATITRVVYENTGAAITVAAAGVSGVYSSNPAPGAAVNLPAAGSANLVITNAGAAGALPLNLTFAGLTAPISIAPAAAVPLGTPGTFAITCANTTAAAVTQTLTITHNGTGAPASPVTHAVTCAAVAPVVVRVPTPALNVWGALAMLVGLAGIGLVATRRHS
jgi:hypothetical protein